MATIMSLPDVVLVMILKKISIKDIENFSSTCKKFRQTAWGNKVWIKKFYERWPSTKKVYDQMEVEDLNQIDFKEQIKEAFKCLREMWQLISQLPKHTNDTNLLLSFVCQTAHSTHYYIFIDELKRIIKLETKESKRTFDCDLTRRYYSCHIILQLKYYRIRDKLLKFLHEPREQQLLERIVTYVVQWFDPFTHISYSYIKVSLDNIAEKVLQAFREECPKHPIFEMTNAYYTYWKNNNISYSYWNQNEIWQILNATQEIVSSQSYFHKLKQLWIQLNNSSLRQNNSVSQGESLFLLIIYHSILRRFGIDSIVITDNMLHIFVKPKDKRSIREYFCFEQTNGQFNYENITRMSDHSNEENYLQKTVFSLTECLHREVGSLSETELKMLQNILKRTFVNITDLMKMYCDYEAETILRKGEPERRSATINFAIGMIVTHPYHNETHFGVIVGWHHCFNHISALNLFSTDNFSNITCKENSNFKFCTDPMCLMHKPYYIILCDNNKYCYVPQENISRFRSPKWIEHTKIGRYFCRYKSTYYVANEALAEVYPYDVAIINEMIYKQLL